MPEIKIDIQKRLFEDGALAVMMECPDYRIYSTGKSFEEAFREFGRDLDMVIIHYALAPDEVLHEKAIEYKKKLMKLMEININDD
jgi:hypothetical protein